jgi:hypothetical protein
LPWLLASLKPFLKVDLVPRLDAFVINLQRCNLLILGNNVQHALGFLTIQRFSASFLSFTVFTVILSSAQMFELEQFRFLVGAPGPEMLVPLSHITVRQPRCLLQHSIHQFVKLVDVFGERFAILHDGQLERHLTQIRLQVHPAVFAGQHISQIQNEIPVVVLILLGWIHRIVEAHGVQIVPHWRTPHCSEHAVACIVIFPCEYSGRFSILSRPLCHIHTDRKYLLQTLKWVDKIKNIGNVYGANI